MKVWSRGGTSSALSSEQVVTSSSSGWRVDWKVSGVPQPEQKVRVPCSDDWKLAGRPDRKRNDAAGTLNQATNGAPLARRQIEQWQAVWRDGSAVVS